MNIADELAGIQANLEYAVQMVGTIKKNTMVKGGCQQNTNTSALCLHLDMVKDYLNLTQKRIDEIEGTLRYSYRDDIESVLKSMDF